MKTNIDGIPMEELATPATGLKLIREDCGFRARVFTNEADHGFIAVSLIERSISLLAEELQGDFLDVGCGEQPYLPYFGHVKSKTACDFDAKRGNVDFACPADNVPLPDACKDAILCTEVLEHVPDPLAVWMEFNRLLRPGGRVLLTTPMYWPPHELPYDFYRYPAHGLRRLVDLSGFRLLALIPRGGPIAFWGQATIHVWQPLFRLAALRWVWNRLILWLDGWGTSARITIGWTVLAEKERELKSS
jgi:SAM-dependent methyltransferase